MAKKEKKKRKEGKLSLISRVVEWLRRRAHDQHGLGSKPTRAILLCPWERHFTALFPCVVVLGKQFQIKIISLLNYSGQQYLGISGSRSQ